MSWQLAARVGRGGRAIHLLRGGADRLHSRHVNAPRACSRGGTQRGRWVGTDSSSTATSQPLPGRPSANEARVPVPIQPSATSPESLLQAQEVTAGAALVSEDPEVMGGLPCFAGTRVPIDTVLASLDEGLALEEVCKSYPFITEGHVSAARAYAACHPRPACARRLAEVSPGRLVRKCSSAGSPGPGR